VTQEEIYKLIEQHYRTNYRRLVKGLSSNSGSSHNAEDVVQNAYFRACEYWTSYDETSDFKGWFNQILNNSLRDKINEERMHGAVDDTVSVETQKPRALHKIMLNQVTEFIKSHPEKLRKILELYFLQQYRSKDIAKVVPERVHHIEQLVYMFRKALKEKFGRVRIFE